MSKTKYYNYNGINYTLTELSKLSGIKTRTLSSRINEKCWSVQKAVETPIILKGEKCVTIGKKYGYVTVLRYLGSNHNHKTMVKCQCDCGNIFDVVHADLISGNTKSCGKCDLIIPSHNRADYHGLTHTRVYQSWVGMKLRCYNKSSEKYSSYGAKGIVVCDEWKNNFKAFYEWAINNGYRDDLTIDRIDVNGNYEPSNCRWITLSEQSWNKQNTIYVYVKGEKLNLCELSNRMKIDIETNRGRYYRGTLTKHVYRWLHETDIC